ncbi:MAG TPA: outer membrane protein assembly factor BamA, partial [Phycisphaeraceae bacterium]
MTVLTWGWAAWASAQGIDPAGRPIAQIQIQGLEQVPEQLVRNQIRLRPGDPYDPQTVEQDIVRITHLGRFSQVRAQVQPQPDGSVILTYLVEEQPLLADVQVVGNKAISDQDLLSRVLLRAGDPADPFLIEQGVQQIRRAYEEEGYFVVDVTPDQELMQESGILIYRIREGPKVRIRAIQFEGNETYSEAELRSKIRSKTYFPILRQGELNREQLELDAARVRDFYRDRGYLDAEVYRRIDLSPDQRSAVVTFVVEEGPQYLVQSIRIEGTQLFPVEQILRAMELRQGGVYSAQQVQQSIDAIRDLYGQLGFLDTSVEIHPLFHQDQPRVDVVVSVEEGRPSLVGKVAVRGNDVTKDKVILRQVRGMTPGRPFDRTGLDKTRQRLMESPLFSESTVTVLGEPGDPVRDVLIQVEEQTTGSLTFGAGVSSDAGVIGAIDLVQRNFDIADVPESAGELFTGKAFRGAGQYFALTIQPGSEVSRYAVNFREPYLLESDYFLDTQLFFFTRELESYDEQRLGGAIGLGQRFGDVWSASVRARATEVELSELEPSVPVDVVAVEGASLVTGLGFVLERNTTDSALFPTEGSAWELGIERVGALGGDFDFTRLTTSLKQFWTVDEDFFGRRT